MNIRYTKDLPPDTLAIMRFGPDHTLTFKTGPAESIVVTCSGCLREESMSKEQQEGQAAVPAFIHSPDCPLQLWSTYAALMNELGSQTVH